jgi:cardiolipin synthase
MRLMYLMAITAAEQSIDIEAAYFIPDALMSRELIKARARGVRSFSVTDSWRIAI